MNTPALPYPSKHDSAGAGRPDRLSVTPVVGAAHHVTEAAAAIVCAALASAIVVSAIALMFL
jgi:hypothetical protein